MKGLNTKKNIKLYLWICLIVVVPFLSVSAWTADFPQRKASAKRSAKVGLGRNKVSLLKRMRGPGHEALADRLVKQFANKNIAANTSGKAKKDIQENCTAVMGDYWYLLTYGDGTSARYRNFKYIENNLVKGKPVSERMSEQDLERLGRKFIKENLSDYIQLGPNESLVPSFTEFQIASLSEAIEGAPVQEKIHASTVVFTRTVDNVNVLGPGSKVAVTFANDGNTVAFYFDWPEYDHTDESQKVLPLSEIKTRGWKLSSVNLDSTDVRIKRFDCGYFDAGRKHDPDAYIQSGCVYHTIEHKIVDHALHNVERKSGRVIRAVVDVIPAGEQVMPDRNWSQVLKIHGHPEKRVSVPQNQQKKES
jgi:hypothetical protein